jgi:hypothetical protein
MDILYRNVSSAIYNLIADKQCQMKKEKKRDVSQSEAITQLLKKSYLEVGNSPLLNTQILEE